MYYQHRLTLMRNEDPRPPPLLSSYGQHRNSPLPPSWLRERDYVEESKMKGYGEKKRQDAPPSPCFKSQAREKTDIWRNQKRAYEHPLEMIMRSECKDGVLWVFGGEKWSNKRDILLRATIWLIILIRASWQVFEHSSLDSCLLKDLFLICQDWFVCSINVFLVSFLLIA